MIFFGLEIGVRSFLKGDFFIAFKRLILPVNYWRVTIFAITADFICKNIRKDIEELKILDIGSPKLLAIYLSMKISGHIVSSDLQDEAIFSEWKKHCKNIGQAGKMTFEFANAKNLPYTKEEFDIIYSISVLHMISPSENGDIVALKEMQSKIRKNGYLIIEVPLREKYCEIFQNNNNFEERYSGTPLFLERQYDEESLQGRISNTIKGNLVMKSILYEKIPFDAFWNNTPKIIKAVFAFAEPWIDILNIGIARDQRHLKRGKSVILVYQIT